jgi:hypothetical protein
MRSEAKVICVISFLYLYFFPYFEKMRNPNELLRLYTARAIIDQGEFSINSQLRIHGSLPDLARYNTRIYANKAPFPSLLGALVYAPCKWIAHALNFSLSTRFLIWLMRLTCSLIPSLIFLFFFFKFLCSIIPCFRETRAILIGYALGTPAYTYAILYYSHQLAAVLAFSGFMLLYSARREYHFFKVLASGLLAGFSVATEYQTAIVAGLLGVYALFIFRRWSFWYLLGLLPGIGIIFVVNYICFGHPLSTPYHHMINISQSSALAKGFMGITYPKLGALYGILFSPSRGLFFSSPFLVIAILGFILWWRAKKARAEFLLTLGVTLAYLWFNSSYIFWQGGWSLGPRLIIPLIPFLVFALSMGLGVSSWLRQGVVTIFIAAFIIFSVIFIGLSTAGYANFPPVYTNPFFEMTLPLWLEGYVPWNPLSFFGVLGLRAAIPFFFVFLGVLFLASLYGTSGIKDLRLLFFHIFAAFLVALFLLQLASLPQREWSSLKSRQEYLIHQMWEPRISN